MAFNQCYAPAPTSAGATASEFWDCGHCSFVNSTAIDRVCKACGGNPPAVAGNGIPAPAAPFQIPVPQRPQQSALSANHYAPVQTPASRPAYFPTPAPDPTAAFSFSVTSPPGTTAYIPPAAAASMHASLHASAPPAFPAYASAPPAVPAYAPARPAVQAYASAPPTVPANAPERPTEPAHYASAPPAEPAYASAPPAGLTYASAPLNHHQSGTFQVPVPPGTQPGQKLGVDTGVADAAPVLVTVPERTEWGGNGTHQFFHVQLPRPVAPSPMVVQGSAAQTGVHESLVGGASYASAASTSQSSAYGSTGSVSPTASAHMAPIAPQHVSSVPTKLVLKEKVMSFTGDDASVKDESGNTLFRIKADVMTMSQRRRLYNSSGQVIGQLRLKKMPGLRPTVYVGTPANEKKCSVKMTGILNPMKCDAKISLGDTKIGRVSGNWKAKIFDITIDGEIVATVSRKLAAASYFAGADSYCINCHPGVDLSFVVLVVISLDELYHDDG